MTIETVEEPPSIPGILAAWAERRPEDAALVTEREEVGFGELQRRVAALAGGLAGLGVRAGTTIGLLCPNRVEWVVTAFAAATLGARVAAFNTWSQRWDLDHMLRHSRCEVLVTVAALRDRDLTPLLRELVPEAWAAPQPGWRSGAYPDLRELVVIGDDAPPGARAFADVAAGPAAEPAATADGDLLVLYTSGSTARPKAVILRHATALRHGTEVGDRMGVTSRDRIWLPVPLFWSYGGANALMVALTRGACLVTSEVFDAPSGLSMIEEHGCTAAYTLPSITAALLADPGFAPERVLSLRRGMTIGSARDVRAAATDLGIAAVCNAYGSTELYGGCCVTPHDWPLDLRCATQGPPLPGMAVHVADPATGAVLPAGETGEITVTGQVTPGYLDQPDANAAAFTADGAFRTGDLGFLDEYGHLHFVARASEMIRSGGINIAPAEVEEYLLTHPGIVEAAVVGVEDERRGEVAIAYVTAAPGADVVEAALTAHCRSGIAAFKVPARIVVMAEALPRTTTGKLERRAVQAMARELWTTGTVRA